ncbi:hypothetical protein [Cellulomonas sp. URHD0024]|uniref:hypothetical protein n=1 Tax=Cellulomonas sp. URHD0024 TaxID=1302620 RepID=UPI0012DBFE7D|nr:hypothetical protein [Cellulomonas sp. URHD0024]
MLDAIEGEGWDGPTGTRLLTYLRERVVRPLAISVGLRGAAASQAEATAWQGVWVELSRPSIRHVTSPWGVIRQVARRQLLGEIVATRFGTNEWRAWKLNADARNGLISPAVSLDSLLEAGWEPEDDEWMTVDSADSKVVLTARRALVAIGWSDCDARRIVDAVLTAPPSDGDARTQFPGWRTMASDLQIPPWQARRLTVALRGTDDWPGLLARIAAEGESAVETPAMRTALLTTRRRSDRSPMLAAQRAEGAVGRVHPQRRAS